MSDIRDDISYMRQLAEKGSRGSIIGGTFLAAAGLIYGVVCFVQWAMLADWLPIPVEQSGHLWQGASIFFAVLWLVLFVRTFRAKSAGARSSASNLAFGMTWVGCAMGIFVTIATIAIIADVSHNPGVQNMYAPATMAFYGSAWFIAGALARRPWMFAASIVAFASTLATAALTGDQRQLLVWGTALLLSLAVPGLKMMFEESR
ncbi:MAG: hypothetical protein WCA78_16440 [Rhizomicrobium sp.]